MNKLYFIRLTIWCFVAVLALFLAVQYFIQPNKIDHKTALRTEQFAPPIAGFNYADQQWTVVNFFASWCVPCRAEHPYLQQLSSQMPIIGIAWKDEKSATDAFLTELGSPFIKTIHDPTGLDSRGWYVGGIPATFLIDSSGKIRYRRLGVLLDRQVAQIEQIMQQ